MERKSTINDEINVLEGRRSEMKLADFRTDRNGNPYGLKKCKYHCDYGDGEYCHYKEIDGCIYNKTKEEIDGQIKGRRMTDAESMGMLFDDPLDLP